MLLWLYFEYYFFLSPGFILSGEYPTLKSICNFFLDIFSIIGIQISVRPGNTVDSKTIRSSSFLTNVPISLHADTRNFMSGLFIFFIGVGNAIIYTFDCEISFYVM